LELHESALLVALARGASHYNPRRHAKRALERRNLVLKVMAERGVVSTAEAKRAAAKTLGVKKQGRRSSAAHPAFIELVRQQLRRDYDSADLATEGLRIFTTLEPATQGAAERSLHDRLAKLEKQKGLPPQKLQGAVVVVEPAGGQVLALVGGRDPRGHGFNRALAARRPIGSLVKPAVYLTALEEDRGLDSPIDDDPVTVRLPEGRTWEPKNYDGRTRGSVPMRDGWVHSLNLATVHLGLELGVPRVAKTLRALGVERKIQPVPSLLLGTLELTPLEVAAMYQPLASKGFRVPLRAIREVTNADGKPLRRYALNMVQAAEPAAVGQLQRALVDVVRYGTARYAHNALPKQWRLAGKTGTTDDLRDSWFAGFGADRLAVVWVGRDDNRSAGLTGSSGALRVWTDLMKAVPPRSLPSAVAQPVEHIALTDPVGPANVGGCSGDLLGGFIQALVGSGCEESKPRRPTLPSGDD
jgi:penicillin-binding protein 1B